MNNTDKLFQERKRFIKPYDAALNTLGSTIIQKACSYVQQCRLMILIALYEWASQNVIFILLHILQNYVYFGDFLGKRTLFDAYH